MMRQSFSPYYAVIFTSVRNEGDHGYAATANEIHELAMKQPGFLGFESAREEIGISVSYWDSLENIQQWKLQSDHLMAQTMGRKKWYASYKVRICKVEREYEFGNLKISQFENE